MNYATLILLAVGMMLGACSESSRRPEQRASENSAPVAAAGGEGATQEASTMRKVEFLKDKVVKSEEQWRKELTPEQFEVMRQKGTEGAFTGKYWNTTDQGVYKCGSCGQALFISENKFDSHCGWPSFDKPAGESIVAEHSDTTFGMKRTEVTCSRCGAHLGHVFDDGPTATGLRYCINSASIELEKDKAGEMKK